MGGIQVIFALLGPVVQRIEELPQILQKVLSTVQ